VKDRRVVLIDDICSTGETLKAAARYLCGEGARSVEIAVVHALISDDDLARLLDAGVSRLVSTDSCLHQTNAIGLAPLIARRLRRELACNR
jgi:ribose-phosphate pyrophosphokinase